jgi:hypothetical protein
MDHHNHIDNEHEIDFATIITVNEMKEIRHDHMREMIDLTNLQ